MRLVRNGAVQAVYQLHYIVHKGRFHHAVHLPDGLPGIFEAAAFVVFVVVVLVYVGHHHDAGRGFAFSGQAVRAFVHFPETDPGGFIPARAVQKIDDRVSLLALIIIGREVHDHPSIGGTGNAGGILYFLYYPARLIIPNGRPWQVTFRRAESEDSAGRTCQQD